MKILITGHQGFVGRHFHRTLEGLGHDLLLADLRSGRDCRVLFQVNGERFDLVIHCAAVVGGRTMIDGAPLQLAAEDLSIDAELWRWALRTRPGRILYFSSSAAYPVQYQTEEEAMPWGLVEDDIDLDDPGMPDATYGWVKLTGELCAREAEAEGIRTTVLRPFSGYGADQDLDYPFPSFIGRAARRDDPFEVWGDGTQVRDFIHIDDVVAATLAAIDHDVDGPVNLCTGRATSFNDLADMAMTAAGYRAPVKHVEAAPVGVHRRVGNPTKLHGFYQPKVTLEEGIARALEGR